jgi:outer membrane immunogenic protein
MRRILLSVLTATLVMVGAFSFSVTGAFAQCAAATATVSAKGSSGLGGGQLGYNWQQGSFVYGVESDLSGTYLKSTSNSVLATGCFAGATASTTSVVDWYGTVRGRAGWSTGKVLVYGTGGLSVGHVGINSMLAGSTAETSVVHAGWVAGVGFEYVLSPNWLLNVDYQYVDLGTANAASTLPGGTTFSQTVSARAAFQVVTAGFSWRFAPAPTWAGGYAGVHGGGDWGNKTSAVYSAF